VQPSLDTSTVTVKVINDYGNPSELKSALIGRDSLVILLKRSFLTEPIALVDAAIATNVKHIVPSSFGTGTHHPYIRSAPTLMEKVQMEDYLTRVINVQPSPAVGACKTTYTVVKTGLFLERGMQFSVLVNLNRQREVDGF
jgi:NmrA-like family